MLHQKEVMYNPLEFKNFIKDKTYYQLKVLQELLIENKEKNQNAKNSSFVKKFFYSQKEDKTYVKKSFFGTILVSSIPVVLSTIKNNLFNFLNNQGIIQIKDYKEGDNLKHIGETCSQVIKYSPLVLIVTMGYNTLYNFVFRNSLIDEKYENMELCENILSKEIERLEREKSQENINYSQY